MNKKGFTLVEVTISMILLSIVMLFMFKLLSQTRLNEDAVSLSTDLLLNKTIISKNINKSIKTKGGIKESTCTNTKCTITFNDNTQNELEIKKDGKIISYKDITNNKVELTRELPDNYTYSIKKETSNNLTIITLVINSHEEYNIEIVNYNIA